MGENRSILDKVNNPEDLKKLDFSELQPLCDEIRETLIDTLSKSGGHLSSNLGTVELTVAIHRMFNSPEDQIVWDVGHQAYTHKILTGRKNKLSTIRKKGGISGFPNPKESEHDAFIAGHSSTSLSAAFGLARAKTIKGEPGYVVAVVGDGAASGGMFYEGLNNIGRYPDRLIVILNDNKISISKNIGGFAKYLSEIRVRPNYFKAKDRIDRFVSAIPLIGKWLRKKIIKSKSMLKYAIYHTTWFEEFGFSYLGPVDGHNIELLCDVIQRAKALNKPVLIHAETVKGKGYKFAEDNPGAYHGVKPFDPKIGDISNKTSDGFSAEFGQIMVELGREDDRICALSPAMKYATGLDRFAVEFPRRFIDVGIAEPLAVTCASGMSKNGMIPVVAIYSSFLQRSYDQVLHDAAISNQHIILAIDRAGIVGEDGETHQGIFDVAFLSTIPNVTIFSPSTFSELRACLKRAVYEEKGVVAVRYPKGTPKINSKKCVNCEYILDKKQGADKLIVTYGRMYDECIEALKKLDDKSNDFDILKLIRLNLNSNILKEASKYKSIVFVEESTETGSISQQFGNMLAVSGYKGTYRTRTLGKQFIPHQTIAEALKEYGLDADGILSLLKE